MDHGQDHLKPLFCKDGMGNFRRHDDHLAGSVKARFVS
jgi:hypothetical protein